MAATKVSQICGKYRHCPKCDRNKMKFYRSNFIFPCRRRLRSTTPHKTRRPELSQHHHACSPCSCLLRATAGAFGCLYLMVLVSWDGMSRYLVVVNRALRMRCVFGCLHTDVEPYMILKAPWIRLYEYEQIGHISGLQPGSRNEATERSQPNRPVKSQNKSNL